MELTVLIPARDEERRVGRVVAAARAAAPGARVLVVDGHSGDDTATEARRAGARVIRQDGRGYAAALRTGYRYLAAAGCPRLVQLDADGQHPGAAVPVLARALEGASFVVGSRAGTGSPGSLPRRLGNGLLALAVRGATGLHLRDVTSGFWALDERAIAAFARHFPEDVADANVRVLAARLSLSVRELPVWMPEREGGLSMHAGVRGAAGFARSVRALVRASRWTPGDAGA